MATPPAKSRQAKAARLCGSAEATEETANNTAQSIRLGLRPKRSPIARHLLRQPYTPPNRLDAAHGQFGRQEEVLGEIADRAIDHRRVVADRNPPKAATKLMRRRNEGSGMSVRDFMLGGSAHAEEAGGITECAHRATGLGTAPPSCKAQSSPGGFAGSGRGGS